MRGTVPVVRNEMAPGPRPLMSLTILLAPE